MSEKKPEEKAPKKVIDKEEQFVQLQKEVLIHREEGKYKELFSEVDLALHEEDTKYDEGSGDEWEALKRHAKFEFPQLAHPRYQSLHAKQKLIAIGECEGWSQEKLEKFSKVPRSTIRAWLKRADVQIFQRDYTQALGKGSPQAKFAQLAFEGAQIATQILQSPINTPEMLKLKIDVMKWSTERAYGPAGKQATGELDPVKLAKAADEMKDKIKKLSTEDLEDLFKD